MKGFEKYKDFFKEVKNAEIFQSDEKCEDFQGGEKCKDFFKVVLL